MLKMPQEITADTTWENCSRLFKSDRHWLALEELDRIRVFKELIEELQDSESSEQHKQRLMQERNNRKAFRELLVEKVVSGELHHKSKWRKFVQIIKGEPRFLKMLQENDLYGTAPHHIFEDQVEQLRDLMARLKADLKAYLKGKQLQFTLETTYP